MTTFIIYGVDFDKKVEVHEKTCKKPTRTKIYKELAKRFSKMEFKRFGYMPKSEYETKKKWWNLK